MWLDEYTKMLNLRVCFGKYYGDFVYVYFHAIILDNPGMSGTNN